MARSTVNVQRRTMTQIYEGGFAAVETLAAARTLTLADGSYLKFDPGGGARDVTLPALQDGLFFAITNAADAAENLVIKDAAGTTVVTISQNERAVVGSDGSVWTHYGIQTIALS